MSKVREIHRFWLDRYDGCVLRKWRPEEYATVSPELLFKEEYYVTTCLCGCRSVHVNMEEAKHARTIHNLHCDQFSFTLKQYVDLVCYEVRERYDEEFDVWIRESENYNGRNKV